MAEIRTKGNEAAHRQTEILLMKGYCIPPTVDFYPDYNYGFPHERNSLKTC